MTAHSKHKNFTRTICTKRECISVSLGDEYCAPADRPIIIEIQSANNIADEATGPEVSCEFHIGAETARRFSASIFAAYVASAAGNPRSELMDHDEPDQESGLFLDAGVTADGKIGITFELLPELPSRGEMDTLCWGMKLDQKSAAQLSEALLSASKIAGEKRALGTP